VYVSWRAPSKVTPRQLLCVQPALSPTNLCTLCILFVACWLSFSTHYPLFFLPLISSSKYSALIREVSSLRSWSKRFIHSMSEVYNGAICLNVRSGLLGGFKWPKTKDQQVTFIFITAYNSVSLFFHQIILISSHYYWVKLGIFALCYIMYALSFLQIKLRQQLSSLLDTSTIVSLASRQTKNMF